jgi:positive regulator of sigma E activity
VEIGMSEVSWGLLPLAMDDSDLMMILLSLFILIVFVILIFLIFPIEFALLMTAGIALAFVYAIHETRRLARLDEEE